MPKKSPPPVDQFDPLLTVKEAARFLRRSEGQLYRDVARGLIPHVRIGESIRFTRAGLVEFVASQQQGAAEKVG